MRKLCSLIGMSILSLSSTAYASDHSKKAQPIDQWLDQIHLDSLSASNQTDQKLLDLKQNLVNFYQDTTVDQSFVDDNGVTIDCIPFKKQLSLIHQSQFFIDKAYQNYKVHGPKEPQDTRCPIGDVLVARPSLYNMNHNNPSAFFKVAPKDTPQTHSASNNDPLGSYTWVDNGHSLSNHWDVAYTSLSMGSDPKMVTLSRAHSLGQIWVLNNDSRHQLSLEAGIVKNISLMTDRKERPNFFIYASVDNYGRQSCYNGWCGHFIRFPNTRPVNDLVTNPSHLLGYHGPTNIYTLAFRQAQQNDYTHRYNYYFSISDGIVDPTHNKTQIQNDTLGYYDLSTANVNTSNPNLFSEVRSGGEISIDNTAAHGQHTWDMGTGDISAQQSDLNSAAVYAYGDATGFFSQQNPQTISYLTSRTSPDVHGHLDDYWKYFHGYTHSLDHLNAWPYKQKPTIPNTIKGAYHEPLKIMAYGGSITTTS